MKKFLSLILVAALIITLFTFASSAAGPEASTRAKVEPGKIALNQADCTIRIIYPYFSGFASAAKLNDTIQNSNTAEIGYIKDSLEELKEYNDMEKIHISYSLDSYFDYNKSGDVLSVIINSYYYTGGAHGMSYMESYTVNTKTNEIYTFSSLFNHKSNYKKVILDKINAMIDKEKEFYFADAKQSVAARNSNYKFYIDGDKLVIYFDLYELRPYAGGMPEFKINAKDLKGLLKDDVYNQMINAKALGKVRLNGTTMASGLNTFEQDYTLMVPLKAVAELLGYKAGWDAKKGCSIDGSYIKNNVNSYSSSKTPETKLSEAPKIKGNVMYVPEEYFSQVLKEDVFYYGDALRIFTALSYRQNQFDIQIAEYTAPNTADKAVNMYARAVKDRKGALQYALFSDKLKAEYKAGFEEMNWVTGVSSPWVTGYDIKDNREGDYDIVFHWATSAGKSPDSIIKLTVAKKTGQEFWEIIKLQE